MAASKDQILGAVAGPVLLWSTGLVLACLLGDLLCSVASQSQLVWRALADSATHGAVGVMSWAAVVVPGWSLQGWVQCLLCGVLAVVIDLDHFWQAGSLTLKAAVSLHQRPPLHSTSVVLILSTLLWIVSHALRLPLLKNMALMCLVAWLSHHLRDASRRGLWCPPFGSTPPLPYAVYIGSIVILSVSMHIVYSAYCHVPSAYERTIETIPKVIVN